MKRLWSQHIRALRLLYDNIYYFLSYQLITTIIVMLILLPFYRFIINVILKYFGYVYISHEVLKAIILSPEGIILAIVSIVISSIAVLLHLGGLIVLSNQLILKKSIPNIVETIKYCMSRLKYMLGFDGALIVLYFVIIAPLLGQDLTSGIFETIDVPSFIMGAVQSNGAYTCVLAFLVLLILYFTCRWHFSLHVLLLEEKIDKHFLKRSSQLIKNNYKDLFRHFVINGIIFFALSIVSIIITWVIAFLVSSILKDVELLVTVFLAILGLLVYVSFLFIVPFKILRMTIFYHNATNKKPTLKFSQKSTGHDFVKKLSALGICIVLMMSYVVLEISDLNNKLNLNYSRVEVTAHRGSSTDAPENTLSAVKSAIKNGSDFVEIDVQLTKDKHLILLHDKTFYRTAGIDQRPDELTLADIKKLEVGSWFSKEFAGEKVPTLLEVIKLSKGKIKLNIEIKGSSFSPNIHKHLVKLLKLQGVKDSVVCTSLEYTDLKRIKQLFPAIKTGYIMYIAFGKLENLDVDFYSVEASNISKDFIRNAHINNKKVHVWTINESEDMREMIELGVDNIITDNDKLLVNILKEAE